MLAYVLAFALAATAHGFIGITIDMYQPSCAHGCRRVIQGVRLGCSEVKADDIYGINATHSTTPSCFASDPAFLTTLAWCIEDACAQETAPPTAWEVKKYWTEHVSGDKGVAPIWSYAETLQNIEDTPSVAINTSELLNYTAIISHDQWYINKVSLEAFEHQETLHTYYGLAVMLLGLIAPMVFTLLLFLPLMPNIIVRMRPYFIDNFFFGNQHAQPLYHTLGGSVPTMGQGLYLMAFFALIIVYTAIDYTTVQPNAMYMTAREELLLYITNRTGIMAFALAPLVILFAGRNNFLLWVTNWSHSTYLLMHRHVARLFTVQIIVHSIVEVELYRAQGHIADELAAPYWVWGVVATVAACLMLVSSALIFRKMSYEFFLAAHIVLAIFVLVGSWYHIDLLFHKRWNYEWWLYLAFVVWILDHMIRLVKLAQNGLVRAEVREIGRTGIMRLDLPGIRWGATPGQHAYVSWPTLSGVRIWENHPFSVIPLSLCQPSTDPNTPAGFSTPSLNSTLASTTNGTITNLSKSTFSAIMTDLEKAIVSQTVTSVQTPTSNHSHSTHHHQNHHTGLRIYLRKHHGLTSRLKPTLSLPTLLEGPYHTHNPTFSASRAGVLASDKLILFAGGIGITALLSWVHAHPKVKLYWTVREEMRALVDDVRESGILDVLVDKGRLEVRITGRGARRLDLWEVLEREVEAAAHEGWRKVGVLSCGPGGFCDAVRGAVVGAGRGEGMVEVELLEEAFGW